MLWLHLESSPKDYMPIFLEGCNLAKMNFFFFVICEGRDLSLLVKFSTSLEAFC